MNNLIYLDHNILDALLKGRIAPGELYLDHINNTTVYSNETLLEIRKSAGYEHKFLEVLKCLKACFLFVESDESGHVTGKWEVREIDPFLEFDALNDALSSTTNSNFGFDEIVQKLYGGAPDKSFSKIAEQSIIDLKNMLDSTLDEARTELSEDEYQMMALHFEDLKRQMIASSHEMGKLFDESTSENKFTTWDDAIGVGPLELKNIAPPKVVEQVWEMISPKLPKEATLEKMFGLAAQYEGAHSPKTNIERCNAIYHALNFFGYYRDSGMKKLRRVHASSADMTHAGYASLCNLLVSDDKDFCMKTMAVYEYLKIETRVVYTNLKERS
ncbi:hypothetical protein [Shewanella algae]|uniref:hypothetical protein n=1 Tax=Shewanella algae TaxID=38313 RepID=UPI001AAE6432|nr:hypothetical protein [Shewanella algae]MBO2587018.1 hypothetical protein [Shewanella algae]